LGARADQALEIGDALRRQTAGEVTLDDLVLDDEVAVHRRRRPAVAGRGSGAPVHTRGFETTRSFHRYSRFRRFMFARWRPSPPLRTRRKNARRQSGWERPMGPTVLDRTALCCGSYVGKPLHGFTFRKRVPRRVATWFAVCRKLTD